MFEAVQPRRAARMAYILNPERLKFDDSKPIKGMEERYSMKFETIGFDENHVHFMVRSLAKYSPSQLFKVIKSVTAKRMFKTYPDSLLSIKIVSFPERTTEAFSQIRSESTVFLI